jgi:uncharacterized membrane protein YkoI
MITRAEAVDIARKAIEGKVTLQSGSPIEVDLKDDRFTVVFVHLLPPGTRGPDYDAKVTIDASSGEVLSLLGSS